MDMKCYFPYLTIPLRLTLSVNPNIIIDLECTRKLISSSNQRKRAIARVHKEEFNLFLETSTYIFNDRFTRNTLPYIKQENDLPLSSMRFNILSNDISVCI
jgi:hypothetical protein